MPGGPGGPRSPLAPLQIIPERNVIVDHIYYSCVCSRLGGNLPGGPGGPEGPGPPNPGIPRVKKNTTESS